MNLARTRDSIILFKGDTFNVSVSPAQATVGWQGGQGFKWVSGVDGEPTVASADGECAGFALWGSNESSDQYTAITGQQPHYRYIVLGVGDWVISTRSYERYTYASRVGGGPLVSLVYAPSDLLYFSLRGYWTKEDEWTISGDPRAPNQRTVGAVVQVPAAVTANYMTVQVVI